MALWDDVKEVVVEQLEIHPDRIQHGTYLIEHLSLNYEQIIELMSALEKAFNVIFHPDKEEEADTMFDLMVLVRLAKEEFNPEFNQYG